MTGRLADDTGLPLELCTGSTPECPHYACPDGWHAGESPNCSCTPDCALEAHDHNPRAGDIQAGTTYCETCGARIACVDDTWVLALVDDPAPWSYADEPHAIRSGERHP